MTGKGPYCCPSPPGLRSPASRAPAEGYRHRPRHAEQRRLEQGGGISVAVRQRVLTRAQKCACGELLGAVGEVIWIDNEFSMDAVTAVSGSGPAYVFLLADVSPTLAQAGLDPALAAQSRARDGRGRLPSFASIRPPAAELRKNVTSPKGTTAAALAVLMGKGGFLEAAFARRQGRRQALEGAVVVERVSFCCAQPGMSVLGVKRTSLIPSPRSAYDP